MFSLCQKLCSKRKIVDNSVCNHFLFSSRCPNRFNCDMLLFGHEWVQIMNNDQDFVAITKKKPFPLFLILVLFALFLMCRNAAGEEVSVTIGPVTISTTSPVDITKMEFSTNLYFTARNNGAQKVTLVTDGTPTMPGTVFWVHFFWFFDIDGVELEPGEEKILEYMIANEGPGDGLLEFGYSILETSEEGTLSVRVRSDVSPHFNELAVSAAVSGKISTGSGLSTANLANAEIRLYYYSGRDSIAGQIDSQGNYSIDCPAVEELEDAFGSRPLPYSTLGYYLFVDMDGYSLGYRGSIEPHRGETVTVDLTLSPVGTRSYAKIGELKEVGDHGYWWLLPNADFSSVAAVQARHPAALETPGHIVMTDLNGLELWKVATDDECWGFDISAEGQIAASSHLGTIYMLNSFGNILWTKNMGGMVRDVEFSPDGLFLFTGPSGSEEIALLDSSTGDEIWSQSGAGMNQWMRNSRCSSDGKRIIVGYSGGRVEMFTDAGVLLWTTYIGEFPMVFEIDDQYNVYASGKNRELVSFDAVGNLRWRERIPNHVVTAGSDNMSDDGSLIVLGTVGGLAIAIDSSGVVLWQRPLEGFRGHNALDVTPDGKWIVIGTAGEEGRSGTVALFDRNGTKIWSDTSLDRRDTGEIPTLHEYDHNQRGAITVAVSDDARYIAAGYGDSTIRIFERSTAPSNLAASAVSDSQILLAWKDNSDDETGFKIERKTGSSGTFSQITTVEANVKTFSDTGLSASTEYYYRVRSYSSVGDSDYSNTASATTQSSGGGGDGGTGGDGSDSGGGNCFIATACFGSIMAEEVQILCAFRDKFLLTNSAGRAFVKLYYKISPKFTDLIRKKEGLKAVIRTVLKPIVWAVNQIVKK